MLEGSHLDGLGVVERQRRAVELTAVKSRLAGQTRGSDPAGVAGRYGDLAGVLDAVVHDAALFLQLVPTQPGGEVAEAALLKV